MSETSRFYPIGWYWAGGYVPLDQLFCINCDHRILDHVNRRGPCLTRECSCRTSRDLT